MMLKRLTVEIKDNGVTEITLSHAKKCNAFDRLMIEEFIQTLEQCEHNPAIKVVVLRAAGTHFCAGADLQDMHNSIHATFEENMADAQRLGTLFFKLYTLRQPTIALIQGDCFGGGLGLVACCDIALASETACFCFSEVKLGLLPAVISPYVIRAIGERQARRYCLTAERINADKAQHIGLIHQAITLEQLAPTLDKLLQRLLDNSAQAMMQTKRLIHYVSAQPIDAILRDNTASAIANARISQEGQTRVQAFLDRTQSKGS